MRNEQKFYQNKENEISDEKHLRINLLSNF